ncbi:hypothetical protein [Micromonospora sp. HM5-17]|jgi:hypothetical protein|uniref:hypothetical protein n=1 Tax=Micromonospora sp. HM5-17 TaxID=2487710 RepID=UPI0018F6AD5B|nr:hypothetical protein [Micromonospora sp. HM5-17]
MTTEQQRVGADPEQTGSAPTARNDAGSGRPDAPAAEGTGVAPGRARTFVLRLVRHEWTLASLGGLLLAVVLTWPTLRDITWTIPQDIGDPTLQAWQIAWGGYAVLHQPLQLWHSNTFYPEPYTYAYSDTLLGYAPFGMIGEGPVAAVIRYNILYVLVHALAFVGAYALTRQLGAGRIGAAVAGVAFAYAPWRLAQAGHLHVLSVGGIALALAMLSRGHGWSLRHGYRPDRSRPGWAFAGWLVAAWQITLGFGIGLPFGYVLALICVAVGVCYLWSWWRRGRRPLFGRRLFVADLVGGLIFAGVTGFMALPYLEVVARHPAGRRTLAQIAQFSPPWHGFLTAPPENWLWGERHAAARQTLSFAGEMTLLPGVVLIGLAFAGLFFSAWRIRHRVVLAVGVLVSVVLASGTTFGGDGNPGYATLVLYVPGWDAIRTPGRLVLWTTLLLGILAAGALTALTRQPATDPVGEGTAPVSGAGADAAGEPKRDAAEPSATPGAPPPAPAPRPGRPVLRPARYPVPPEPVAKPRPTAGRGARTLARLVAAIPLALVVLEGVNTTPHAPVIPQPAALRGAEGPLLVLPASGTLEFSVMLWSTDGFPKIVNGLASFTPESQARTHAVTTSFPDRASVDYLRGLGIRTVVVLPEYLPGSPWQDVLSRPVDGLGVTREEIGGHVVFRLG